MSAQSLAREIEEAENRLRELQARQAALLSPDVLRSRVNNIIKTCDGLNIDVPVEFEMYHTWYNQDFIRKADQINELYDALQGAVEKTVIEFSKEYTTVDW